MLDIDLCKQTIQLNQIKLSELKNTAENTQLIRFYKTSIAIEQNKQAALEKEFRNL